MSKRFETAGAPSQRQLRVGESIRHAIAEVLARGDLHDATIARHVISITEVRLSPDLKIATVFFMPLGGKAEKDVLKALATNAYQLRKDVAKRVNLKFAPDLRFRIDNSFGEASRIDRLLDDESVRRDTGIASRIGMVGHTSEPDSDEGSGR